MIKMFITGRLVADPRLSDKVNCCNFTVAADSAVFVDGKPKTEFFQVTVWGKKGESCSQYLKKGDTVSVAGDYSSHEYKTRDGETRFSFNISNADVQFGAKNSNAQPAPQSAQPAQGGLVEVDDGELPF